MSESERLAVIGLGCRFPDASSPEELWQTVLSQRRAFRRIPPERLPLDEYLSADPSDADTLYVRRAAVLEGWEFDRARFHVPGALHRAADVSHWLALDVAAEALADAGFPDAEGLDRQNCAVIVGNTLTGEFSRAGALRLRWPYVRRVAETVLAAEGTLDAAVQARLVERLEEEFKRPFARPGDETLAGALSNTIAGRVCNYYDFHGGGYTVDAACAASLLAIITACRGLLAHDYDFALAGGVDVSLDPFELVGFSRLGAVADGDMRVYDERPTGFLPGEGCGMVALVRTEDAIRSGARIYATVAGWGVSSDGRGGLTRPEVDGQLLAVNRAYDRAGFDAGTVDLFEGHGTGTDVGDQVEIEVLTRVLQRRGRSSPAWLGSIKANIGHTKAAAGVAGFLKAALAVDRRILPPATGWTSPHPALAAASSILRLSPDAEAWAASPRRAAVSAMGFGGINTHVVVEGVGPPRRHRLTATERRLSRPPPDREIVALSAPTVDALQAAVAEAADFVGRLSMAEARDFGATLAGTEVDATRPCRAAVVAGDPEGLEARLRAAHDLLAEGETTSFAGSSGVFLHCGPPCRVGLLFPGQAAPIYATPGLIGQLVDVGDVFGGSSPPRPADGQVIDTAIAQPIIVGSSLAGLRWLDALGVHAVAALGHSLGELTALHWAGCLLDHEVLEVARARGAAMSRSGVPGGGMISVAAAASDVTPLLDGTAVVIAGRNAPRLVALAGPAADLDLVAARARERGIRTTALNVSHAFHSPAMAPAAVELRDRLAATCLRRPTRTVVSSVSGRVLDATTPLDELLVKQLTSPVLFSTALEAMSELVDLFVEAGPGTMLSSLVRSSTSIPVVALDCGSSSAHELAGATAALFAAGRAEVGPYFAGRFSRPIDVHRPRVFLANPCEAGRDAVSDRDGLADQTVAAPLASPDDVIGVVRTELGRELELEPPAIRAHDRLLSDLHLNSLSVSEISVAIAKRLGKAVPVDALTYADATVAELARAVEELPAATDDGEPDLKAGVAPWVRVFHHRLRRLEPLAPAGAGPTPSFRGVIAPQHPLRATIAQSFTESEEATVTLIALAPGIELDADFLTEALQTASAAGLPTVVVHHRGVGAAVGRSLFAELRDVPGLVVDVPAGETGVEWARREAAGELVGYREIVYDDAGNRQALVTEHQPLPSPHRRVLGANASGVCLVTGGAKGIGAECAIALAEASGDRLALVGRSAPDDREVVATLERCRRAGVQAAYYRADVTEQTEIRSALHAIGRDQGTVTTFLHCAGSNIPARIDQLTADAMRATIGPKAVGLDTVVAELDPSALRLIVTFGSIIARVGLAGESHYAIANEYLRLRVEALAQRLPQCRCLNVEWSVWAGAGMGEQLGVLDRLTRQGVSPIPITAGVGAFVDLVADDRASTNVMVTGRFPRTPALVYARDDVPMLRFLEDPVIHHPGVELVVETDLSRAVDVYLEDHTIDGVTITPAVVGLEAMAQAARAVTSQPGCPQFLDVELNRPVVVQQDEPRRVRIAALVHDDTGQIELVVRSEETGFAIDHFRARCRLDEPLDPVSPAVEVPPRLILRSAYRHHLFHGPRFQRLVSYELLGAHRCRATVEAQPAAEWFAGFHSQQLVLGDLGARDAYLHVLQGCVPDRRVIPTGVASIRILGVPHGLLTVTGVERASEAGSYLYDVMVEDSAGKVVETWTGLRLKEIGILPVPDSVPLDFVGAYLARAVDRVVAGTGLDAFAARPSGPGPGDPASSETIARALLGDDVDAAHTSDGRLWVSKGFASASHHGVAVLTAVAGCPVAVDWQSLDAARPQSWRDVLGPAAHGFAEQLSRTTAEPLEQAQLRAWTIRETSSKLGHTIATASPVLATVEEPWVFGRAGDARFASTIMSIEGFDEPVAVAVAVGAPDHSHAP